MATKNWYAVTFTDTLTNKFDADVIDAPNPDMARTWFMNSKDPETRIHTVQRVFSIRVGNGERN